MTVQPQATTTILSVSEATVSIQHEVERITLKRLVPSPANVRRVNCTVGVSELADSIEAVGLLHNLTVRKGKKGTYEVVAGSRRLAACVTPTTTLNCHWPKTYSVRPCTSLMKSSPIASLRKTAWQPRA